MLKEAVFLLVVCATVFNVAGGSSCQGCGNNFCVNPSDGCNCCQNDCLNGNGNTLVCRTDQAGVAMVEGEKQNGVYAYIYSSSEQFHFGEDFDDVPNVTEVLYGYCIFCKQLTFEIKEARPTVLIAQGNETFNLCRPNATGFLCSSCEDGFYHNRNRDCVKCSNLALNWFYFILLEFVPMTVIFIILYVTGFSLVAGGLNSAIFFAQMITTTLDITADGYIPLSNITNNSDVSQQLSDVYRFLYEPWNLEFFSPWSWDLCLFHANSFLNYIIVEYAIALYPVALLFIGIVLTAVYRKLHCPIRGCRIGYQKCVLAYENKTGIDWKESTYKLVASVFALSYTKLAITSFRIVTEVPLRNRLGEEIFAVSLYDPNIGFKEPFYSAIFSIALIILVLLFLFPLLLLALKYFRDVKMYYKYPWLDNLVRPFIILDSRNQTVDISIGQLVPHFKDNRWVEAVYFLLRLALLILFSIPFNFIKRYFYGQVICLIGAMFISFVQPYNDIWMNRVDTFMLLLLVFINTLTIYQFTLTRGSLPLSRPAFYAQYVLLYIPAVWIALYIVYMFCQWIKSHFTCTNNDNDDNTSQAPIMSVTSDQDVGASSFQTSVHMTAMPVQSSAATNHEKQRLVTTEDEDVEKPVKYKTFR